ncbi:hypothetical protein LZD49_03895 [Dyadobacter sp. CY261]|uniref:hypothetical protein n=1 Tax=Dyadobacter sp. CY261 TaxID=2907203 RepID=UPI001F15EFE9|nr:hypothetical protein [Dyadobacter sp. CY261]MCF0069599.1 hypothetical protein [Dyadobacter sp. CY261]
MENFQTGSNLPITDSQVIEAVSLSDQGSMADTGRDPQAAPNTSWFATWRGNGVIRLRINCPIIHANSRVHISISEFSNTNNAAGSRFIGSARYAIYNIAPTEGAVNIWADVTWGSPINIYFSLLIEN